MIKHQDRNHLKLANDIILYSIDHQLLDLGLRGLKRRCIEIEY